MCERALAREAARRHRSSAYPCPTLPAAGGGDELSRKEPTQAEGRGGAGTNPADPRGGAGMRGGAEPSRGAGPNGA